MKTVLFAYHTSSIGGGSFCLLNLLRSLDRNIIKPIVLLKEDGPLSEELHKLNIPTYFFPLMSTVPYNSSLFTPNGLRKVFSIILGRRKYKKILGMIKPDIVYANTMMLYHLLKPSQDFGCKTVVHIREHWPEDEHVIQRKFAIKSILNHSDSIVAINQYSASMVENPKIPVTIVYDWIDLSQRFKPFSMSDVFEENVEGKKIFLYMGGMQSIKGAHEVLISFSKIINSPDARLLVMGIDKNRKPPRNLKNTLKKVLQIFGYKSYSTAVYDAIVSDSRIKCIPSIYEVNEIIRQSYCILSYFTIPHANLALAESIILGTPSIAANTPESIEYSYNGRLASLFEINNLTDFEEHLQRIDEIRPQIMDRILKEKENIQIMFDPKSNSDKINNLIKSLI